MKKIALLVTFVAASVAPAFFQTFWNNKSPSGITDGIWGVSYADAVFTAVI